MTGMLRIFLPMRTKPIPVDPSREECMDAIQDHWDNAWAIGELLAMCEEVRNAADVNVEAVGRAGRLLVKELREMRLWLDKLNGATRRRESP